MTRVIVKKTVKKEVKKEVKKAPRSTMVKTIGERKDRNVAFRVTEKEFEKLRKVSRRHTVTGNASEFVRAAVKEKMAGLNVRL